MYVLSNDVSLNKATSNKIFGDVLLWGAAVAQRKYDEKNKQPKKKGFRCRQLMVV
jgi:hypothetical protein